MFKIFLNSCVIKFKRFRRFSIDLYSLLRLYSVQRINTDLKRSAICQICEFCEFSLNSRILLKILVPTLGIFFKYILAKATSKT